MHATRLTALLGAIAVGLAVPTSPVPAQAIETERNGWPAKVTDAATPSHPAEWTAAGPLLFGRLLPDGGSMEGFRPLWVEKRDAQGQLTSAHFLYPVFSYYNYGNTYRWNILELIRDTAPQPNVRGPISQYEQGHSFEVWPILFSRETGDPATSYHAVFPIGGTVKNKIGMDRATWALFPLYLHTSKKGVETTSAPWPFVRVTQGAAHGFGLWPLFEWRERPGAWRTETILWPFGYNNTSYPAADAAPGTPPTREIGVLPLYARRTGPGLKDETFLWPFFGYTDRTTPTSYHEARYFWPLLVQGRGDKYVNRWAPVYTHSVSKGLEKTWFAWPVYRHQQWEDRGLTVAKTQILYFLYWSEHQRSTRHPEKPAASLTHLWPLFSRWDNGAGHEQVQLLSPLDVFFTGNEKMQATWSPLFAIARYEQTSPGETRTSLLWNAVTWRRSDTQQQREFHFGPLFSVASAGADKRVAIGNGLISFRREAGQWKLRWLDFPSKSTTAANQPR